MHAPQAVFQSSGEDDTRRLGQLLAEVLDEVFLVALSGPLGAGKTRLVQSLAGALGVDPRDVVSPTFVLEHEYRGRRPIYHVDTYRLRDSDEFLQLGIDERFCLPHLVLVEWADRVLECLPQERLEISIEPQAGDERRFAMVGHGQAAERAVARLHALLPR